MLIGIDWGGTKIEGVAMQENGAELLRLRKPTHRQRLRCLNDRNDADYFAASEALDGVGTGYNVVFASIHGIASAPLRSFRQQVRRPTISWPMTA